MNGHIAVGVIGSGNVLELSYNAPSSGQEIVHEKVGSLTNILCLYG